MNTIFLNQKARDHPLEANRNTLNPSIQNLNFLNLKVVGMNYHVGVKPNVLLLSSITIITTIITTQEYFLYKQHHEKEGAKHIGHSHHKHHETSEHHKIPAESHHKGHAITHETHPHSVGGVHGHHRGHHTLLKDSHLKHHFGHHGHQPHHYQNRHRPHRHHHGHKSIDPFAIFAGRNAKAGSSHSPGILGLIFRPFCLQLNNLFKLRRLSMNQSLYYNISPSIF